MVAREVIISVDSWHKSAVSLGGPGWKPMWKMGAGLPEVSRHTNKQTNYYYYYYYFYYYYGLDS